ncbi:MAG: hypothetical protein AAF798_10075 [Bacteroidota bacterium]
MKWQVFKNRFSKEARQEEAEVDIAAIWEAIEPQVDALNKKKKRKKRGFFWLFFIGVAAMVAFSTYWITHSSTDLPNEAKSEQLLVPSVIQQQQQESDIDCPPVIAQATSTPSIATLPTPSTTPKSQVPLPSLNSPQKSTNELLEAISPISTVTLPSQLPSASNSPETINSITSATPLSTSHLQTIAPLPKRALSLLVVKPKYPAFPSEPILETTPEKKQPKHQFFTEVYGGVSAIDRTLSAKDAASASLLQVRDQYETPLEALQYGLTVGMQHRPGFWWSVGIQSTTLTERFAVNETTSVVDSIMGIQALRINITGDTVPIAGMIAQTTTTNRDIEIFNTYHLLDIPLTIGYDYQFGERWRAGVSAGIAANISLQTKGSIPDELLQLNDIEAEQASFFQSNLSWSYHFGLSVSYALTDHFELRLAPTIQVYTDDFSVEGYGISQKYTLLGGRLGLRYQF